MDSAASWNSMDQDTIRVLLGSLQPGGFNVWGLAASFIFGIIGFYAFLHGKREGSWKRMILGILLLVYPYFVPGVGAAWFVGALLCAVLYFWKD